MQRKIRFAREKKQESQTLFWHLNSLNHNVPTEQSILSYNKIVCKIFIFICVLKWRLENSDLFYMCNLSGELICVISYISCVRISRISAAFAYLWVCVFFFSFSMVQHTINRFRVFNGKLLITAFYFVNDFTYSANKFERRMKSIHHWCLLHECFLAFFREILLVVSVYDVCVWHILPNLCFSSVCISQPFYIRRLNLRIKFKSDCIAFNIHFVQSILIDDDDRLFSL